MAVVMMMKPLAVIVGFVVIVTLFCAADVCIATPQTQHAEQVAGTPEELEALRFRYDKAALNIILLAASSLRGFEEYHERIKRINTIRQSWTFEEVNDVPNTMRKTSSAAMGAALRDIANIVQSKDFREILLKKKNTVLAFAIKQQPVFRDAIIRVFGYIVEGLPSLQPICSDLTAEDKVERLSEDLRKSQTVQEYVKEAAKTSNQGAAVKTSQR